MEGEQDRRNSKTSGNLSMSRGYAVDPWHRTPVNKTSANGLESSAVQRQRLELQLLIAELKDRDEELNNLAVAHHRQLLSWEQDRQRVLTLEQRCARLEDELQKRNDVIGDLSKRTMVMEVREEDVHRELNSTQKQLHELSQRELNTTRHQQDLEEKNQSLNSTIMMLSTQVGQLQLREEELSSVLRLKDKDVIEATDHILELSGRLCELEKSLEELRTRESKTLRETEEHKHCFRESRHENTQLRAELQEKTIENSSQREEVICLKQENQLLKKELTAVELQLLSFMTISLFITFHAYCFKLMEVVVSVAQVKIRAGKMSYLNYPDQNKPEPNLSCSVCDRFVKTSRMTCSC
ncbi:coiled-coil domain-containing protein 62-like isoform X2 [Myxocyprinus asiaticus]|uniref:coiled-coil domain-containing protein 62-like isoform X2 n=1 Tax=Myxocyprinus asiaticus TaxID=70543 RepID=UPI00222151AC|nr:coiled-coil domain-containing protein 62-like isoform X2 [Myxocyprinus asiaticus]